MSDVLTGLVNLRDKDVGATATECEITPNKTYANMTTLERAVKRYIEAVGRVARKNGDVPPHFRYIVMRTEEGRLFPVFLGQEAITWGTHFHFNILKTD